ncbi:hypothetical protein [Rhizobium sp. OAE497]
MTIAIVGAATLLAMALDEFLWKYPLSLFVPEVSLAALYRIRIGMSCG